MAGKSRAITVKPVVGGRLVTNYSSENAGLYNYTVKRDWRRREDVEIRSEGYVHFYPNASIPIGTQNQPPFASGEHATLIGMARRGDGKTMMIAASPTTICAFYALDNQGVFETGVFETGVFEETPADWIVIGIGFSSSANRWEVASVGDYLVFNNGVDLPVKYRVGEFAVTPLYELREAGIAAVGSIIENSGILLCGDVSQVKASRIEELLLPTDSGAITAAQTGAEYSGSISATIAVDVVTATGAFFTAAHVGQTLRFANGLKRVVSALLGPTSVQVTGASVTTTEAMQFWMLSGDDDRRVTASADIFTADMVGLRLFWDNGDERTIKTYESATSVLVNSDLAIASGTFSIENPDAYGPITDQTAIDRYQWRTLWSATEGPDRFAASIPGAINAGSRTLTLEYPVESLERGQEVIVLGAGLNEGNLTATIESISAGGRTIILSAAALTTVEGALVSRTDAIGSIVGYEDLTGDGSGIVAMRNLKKYTVVYKDTEIYLAGYTGVVTSPFLFDRIYKETEGGATSQSRAPYYRHAIANVGGEFHLYPGRNSFYRLDLTSQRPQEFPALEACKNLFFDHAELSSVNDIFCAENVLTKEIMFIVPNDTEDKAIRYDYQYNTVSTTSMEFKAAASIKRPLAGAQPGAGEDWFVMALADGTLVRYGLVDAGYERNDALRARQDGTVVTATGSFFTEDHVGRTLYWQDNVMTVILAYISPTQVTVDSSRTVASLTFKVVPGVWTRLGETYDSVLQSGLEGFRDELNDKYIERYAVLYGSRSVNTEIEATLLGSNTPSDEPSELGTRTFNKQQSMTPAFFRRVYFGDRLTVTGANTPMELAGRTMYVGGIQSRGLSRLKAD